MFFKYTLLFALPKSDISVTYFQMVVFRQVFKHVVASFSLFFRPCFLSTFLLIVFTFIDYNLILFMTLPMFSFTE